MTSERIKLPEFVSRMRAQRSAVKLINSSSVWSEPIFGLSNDSIERFLRNNGGSVSRDLAFAIKETASSLSFLANHSQDQITDAYHSKLEQFNQSFERLKVELKL